MKLKDNTIKTNNSLPANLVEQFETFFEKEDTRKPGQNVYEEIFDSAILFPLQRKREMAFMMQCARAIAPRVVYEIGSDKAGGLYHWCKCLPSVDRVIACEIRGLPYADVFEKAFPHIDFLWIPDSSYDSTIVSEVSKWLKNDQIDCIFIDGDKHNFDTDFFAYFPLLNPNGLAFFHDIQDESTRRGYDKVVNCGFNHEEHIDLSESHEAVKREKEGVVCSNPHEQWLRYWGGRSAGVGLVYPVQKVLGE